MMAVIITDIKTVNGIPLVNATVYNVSSNDFVCASNNNA